jgi:hypothetical protein
MDFWYFHRHYIEGKAIDLTPIRVFNLTLK